MRGPIQVIESVAVPVLMANVDTDVITPARRLTGPSQHPLHHYAFEAYRYIGGDGDVGAPDPAFPINQERYRGGQILVTGPNFGVGSSRETAAEVIADLGFRVIIGTTFGDIFFANCFQQGMLPIRVPEDVLGALVADDAPVVTVDLDAQTIRCGDQQWSFEVSPLRKRCLLNGTDELGLVLDHLAVIEAWEQADRQDRPWIHGALAETGRG